VNEHSKIYKVIFLPKKSKPLTRAELLLSLRKRLSLSNRESQEMLEAIFEGLSEALEEGRSVKLESIGLFEAKSTPARPGRNPKTGLEVEVPAKLRPTFSMSKELRERMERRWSIQVVSSNLNEEGLN
jgi:nucleoid DNA-binding protein